MTIIFDNHANHIEYFDIHKNKQDKPKKLDIKSLSNNEVLERLTEAQIHREELSVTYNLTKDENTFSKISKTTGFISIIRADMRKRGLDTYENLTMKICNLEKQLNDFKLKSNTASQDKNEQLELVNLNLKNEVKSLKQKIENLKLPQKGELFQENFKLRERNKALILQIEELKIIMQENREFEKTKRHELSSSRALLIHSEFKKLIYEELGEQEYGRLISKACEIVDNQ